ncbi:MAG: hypothetical protein K0S12_1250 [Bacteroidetes bacterium]|nr:hypothetical protein [Bacteroidota bacterium]
MKKLIVLLLTFLNTFCFSQVRKADTHIKKLHNDQFIIDHEHKASFKFKSSEAYKLIKSGKPVSEKLIAALNDPDKVIMAHLILCHIYFGKATFAGPKKAAGDEDIDVYFLGAENGDGLIIHEVVEGNTYRKYVHPKDREEIITYWKKRTSKK